MGHTLQELLAAGREGPEGTDPGFFTSLAGGAEAAFEFGGGSFNNLLDALTAPFSAGRNLLRAGIGAVQGDEDAFGEGLSRAGGDLASLLDTLIPDALSPGGGDRNFFEREVLSFGGRQGFTGQRTFSKDILRQIGFGEGDTTDFPVFGPTTQLETTGGLLDFIDPFGGAILGGIGKVVGKVAPKVGAAVGRQLLSLAEREGAVGATAAALVDLGGKVSKGIRFRQAPGFVTTGRDGKNLHAALVRAVGQVTDEMGAVWKQLDDPARRAVLEVLETPGARASALGGVLEDAGGQVDAGNQLLLESLGQEVLGSRLGEVDVLRSEGAQIPRGAGQDARDVVAKALRDQRETLRTQTPFIEQAIAGAKEAGEIDPKLVESLGEFAFQSATQRQAAEKLGAKGRATVDTFLRGSEDSRRFLTELLESDPERLGLFEGVLGGKLGREKRLLELGELTPDGIGALARRTGTAHLKHVLADPKTAGPAFARELSSLLNVPATTPLPALLLKARRSSIRRAREIGGTIDEINRAKPGLFIDDLPTIIASEGIDFAGVATADDFLSKVAADRRWVQPLEAGATTAGPGWIAVPDSALRRYPKQLRDAFKGKQIRQEVWEDVNQRWLPALNDELKSGAGVKFLNGITSLWTAYTLPLNPGFHARNVLGNIWMAYLGGARVTDVRHWATAGDLMRGAVASVKVGGETMSRRRFMLEAALDGVFGYEHMQGMAPRSEGIAEMIFGKVAKKQTSAARTALNFVGRAVNPNPGVNPAIRAGYKVGKAADESVRLGFYLMQRNRGNSRVQSANLLRKHIYGAEELTEFEKKLRPLFPFYSFARFNIIDSFKTVATQPHKVAKVAGFKVRLDQEQRIAEIPDDVRPKWIREQTGLNVRRDKDGGLSVFVLDNWWTTADLGRIDSAKKLSEFVIQSVNPGLRVPIELTFNFDSFFERAISRYPGETEEFMGVPVSRKIAKSMRTIGLIRQIDQEILPLIRQAQGLPPKRSGNQRYLDSLAELGIEERLTRLLTGGKIRKIGLTENRQRALQRLSREMGTARGRRRRALASGERANVAVLEQLLEELKERRRDVAEFVP